MVVAAALELKIVVLNKKLALSLMLLRQPGIVALCEQHLQILRQALPRVLAQSAAVCSEHTCCLLLLATVEQVFSAEG